MDRHGAAEHEHSGDEDAVDGVVRVGARGPPAGGAKCHRIAYSLTFGCSKEEQEKHRQRRRSDQTEVRSAPRDENRAPREQQAPEPRLN